MAFTRKFLAALGIEADKVDEIITAHAEVVDALKADRDKYKADAEKLGEVQKEVDELKQKNGDDWKGKYEHVKKEFDEFKTVTENKEVRAKKSDALRALLKEAGISEKRLDSVLKVSDIDGVELDNDGKIKDAKDRTAKIKEEWADFIQTEQKKGADTNTPPTGQGNATGGMNRAQELAKKFYEARYGKAPDAGAANTK